MLASLEITDFRNLAAARLDCGPGLHLVTGDNASGKTSLLEAIYVLSRARSFRTRRPTELIRRGAGYFRLLARLAREGHTETLGLQRDAEQFHARFAGAVPSSLAELARVLPVLLLTPDSHRLLEGGPRARRRFLDWGAFQRDASFLGHWRRYQLALRQRNAALRDPRMLDSLAGWETELEIAATPLDAARAAFVLELEAAAAPQLAALLGTPCTLALDYRCGWNREHGLARLLAASREADRRVNHTRAGAHRGDFIVRVNGRSTAQVLSRGQHKLLVAALVLAQAGLYHRHANEACVLLVDDLPAELDRAHHERFLVRMAASGAQAFVTAVDPMALLAAPLPPGTRSFRLQAGQLHEVI